MMQIKEIVTQIIQDKKDKKIVPAIATQSEIRKHLYAKANQELKEMVKKGELKYGQTINEIYFEYGNNQIEENE